MALSLEKGGNLSLTKEAPGMSKVRLGLGWDVRATEGIDFDLDASVFMLNESGKVRSPSDFIFYNQLQSTCGSVLHTGDNRTGEGEGDDESLIVELSKVPNDVVKLAVVVTIHDADKNHQNFGQVDNAFVRAVNEDNNQEVARFDLSEDASTETAMIFSEVYKRNGEWKFKAVGQGFSGGLKALANHYGVAI